ncbi:MAG: methyltransferase [Endozoicomonas sp.]
MNSDSLSNTSQLVLRNGEWLRSDKMLLLGLPADDLASQLLQKGIAGEIHALTRDFSVYRLIRSSWERCGDRQSLTYGPQLPDLGQGYDGILLFLQKSKPLTDFWLDMAQSVLAPGGCIWLVGENGEGIKSWRKRLKNSFSVVKNLDNARHCSLLEGSGPLLKPGRFQLEDGYSRFDLEVGQQSLQLFSLPGVFSHGRVDQGTQVLLDTFDHKPSGRVLDFGCGAGVISAYLGLESSGSRFTLVDCDALALESARRTMAANSIDLFETIASDGLSEVSGQFDLIVSNPPFHQGIKTHYAVTEQFLEQSADLLVKGGELRIVANSFLRYDPIIVKTFGYCQTLVTRNGFSVYQARKA